MLLEFRCGLVTLVCFLKCQQFGVLLDIRDGHGSVAFWFVAVWCALRISLRFGVLFEILAVWCAFRIALRFGGFCFSWRFGVLFGFFVRENLLP